MNENDSRMERRVREALDALSMPEGLKERTLAAYDELAARAVSRSAEEEGFAAAPRESGASVSGGTGIGAHGTAGSATGDDGIDAAHKEEPASSPDDRPRIHVVPGGAGAAVAAPRRNRRGRLFGLAAAACFVLALVGFGGWRLYSTPTAYVGIEVNPSIELGVNRFGIVVSENALNEDGQALLDAVDLSGKAFAEALQTLEQSEAFASYATDDAFVAISVAADDEGQESELVAEGDAFIGRLPCSGHCGGASAEERDEALAAGMGVGRYRMACALTEADPSITLEDCASMTMRELRNRLAEATGETGDDGFGMGSGGGGGSGMGSGGGSGSSAGSHAQGGKGSGAHGSAGGHGGYGRGSNAAREG